MNWTNNALTFLGLSPLEMDVLDCLDIAKKHQGVATELEVPRTTIDFTVKRLVEKGLVIPIAYGRRFRYLALTEAELIHKLEHTVSVVRQTIKERKGAQVKISKASQFTIYVGLNEILPAHARIVSMNPKERVFAIQPNKSWMNLHKKLSPTQLISFNNTIRENKIIIEAIIQENAYKLYKIFFKKDPDMLKGIAESFTGRMADYTLIPEQFLDHHAELWLFKTTVLFINWEEEVAIEIQNPDIMHFVKDMFEIIKGVGSKVDHNRVMRELLA
jgi:predicted transcriptional regulator